MALSIPANTAEMMTKIEDTVELNAIPKEEIKKKIIDNEFVNQLANNGGILMVITIPLGLIAAGLFVGMFVCARTNVKCRGLYIKVKNKLLYNPFLRGLITAYVGLMLMVITPE